MAHSKLTLIVDGNWLLLSRMAAMNNRYSDDKQLCEDLKLTLLRSMNVVLRTFHDIDNIIFVSDGGSWRNTLKKPEFLEKENIDYKGNRERDASIIDWDLLFSTFNTFIDELKENGINTYHEFGIEGDDWAWYWSTKLNNDNTNCIIWTKDQDLKQLVKTNVNGFFTVWWNQSNGVFEQDIKMEEEFNFFFNPYYNENSTLLQNIINSSGNAPTKINPMHIVVDKIIRGDKGDNIFPCLVRKCGSRDYRIKEKDIDYNMDITDKDYVKNYFEHILNLNEFKGKVNKSINNILEHFEYNTRLVQLTKESYPQEIIDIFNKYDIPDISKDLSLLENKLLSTKNNIVDILNTI